MLIESSSRLQNNSEVACFPQSLTSKKLPNLPGLRRPCKIKKRWQRATSVEFELWVIAASLARRPGMLAKVASEVSVLRLVTATGLFRRSYSI